MTLTDCYFHGGCLPDSHGHSVGCEDCGARPDTPCNPSASRAPAMCCAACWHDQKNPR